MSRGLHEAPRSSGISFKSAALGLVMVAAAVVGGVTSTSAPRAAAAAPAIPSASTAAAPCPTGYTCVTLPCATGTCPTVEAGPTSDLGTNPAQYAFVKLYDFPPGDSPEIALCADTVPLSKSAPLCSTGPAPVYAPIFSDGTGFITYQVIEDENGPGQTAISGEVLGDDAQKGTFYCDDGPDLCSLVVFDQGLDGSSSPDASNAAVIPVTYEANSGGCPSATLVNTESDFGIEGLVEAANKSGCTGTSKAIAFNTALDSSSAVSALGTGSVQIAFTDDPEAADEQSVLGGSKSHYALIPVAASADVLGFAANIQGFPPNNHALYPQTAFELTPNMVAGMATTIYNGVGDADLLAGVKCLNPGIPPPKKIDPCPGEEVLNGITSFQPEQSYTTYVRSDSSGVTDELLHWLCAAPDDTVPINGSNATETDTAAQVLESTKWSNSSLDGTCPQTDQFPGLGAAGVARRRPEPGEPGEGALLPDRASRPAPAGRLRRNELVRGPLLRIEPRGAAKRGRPVRDPVGGVGGRGNRRRDDQSRRHARIQLCGHFGRRRLPRAGRALRGRVEGPASGRTGRRDQEGARQHPCLDGIARQRFPACRDRSPPGISDDAGRNRHSQGHRCPAAVRRWWWQARWRGRVGRRLDSSLGRRLAGRSRREHYNAGLDTDDRRIVGQRRVVRVGLESRLQGGSAHDVDIFDWRAGGSEAEVPGSIAGGVPRDPGCARRP